MAADQASRRSWATTRTLGLVLFVLIAWIRGPVQAQDIMSFEAYQALDHPEPYILRLRTDAGALLYFGSRHSFEPTDPQMEQLDEVWTAFRPEVVYTEGGEPLGEALSRTEAIERYGEVGLTWFLAQRDSVPVRSLDPSRGAEITYLQGQGWEDAQLMLFYTLRNVAQSQSQQVTVDLAEAAPRYLASLTQRFDLEGPTTLAAFEEAVARLLPSVPDWTTIPMRYFYPGPQNPSYFTNEIATASNQFRDRHHVRLLEQAVRAGARVFAIAGSAHVVMQEPALRTGLQGQ